MTASSDGRPCAGSICRTFRHLAKRAPAAKAFRMRRRHQKSARQQNARAARPPHREVTDGVLRPLWNEGRRRNPVASSSRFPVAKGVLTGLGSTLFEVVHPSVCSLRVPERTDLGAGDAGLNAGKRGNHQHNAHVSRALLHCVHVRVRVRLRLHACACLCVYWHIAQGRRGFDNAVHCSAVQHLCVQWRGEERGDNAVQCRAVHPTSIPEHL